MSDDNFTPSDSAPDSGPTPESLAWAAGFLDGEGCIHIARQLRPGRVSRTYRLGVHVAQNDLGVLEALRDAVGITAPIFRVKRASNHSRQCYTLNFTGHAALKLLATVLEHLRRKRAEAEAALEFWTRGAMGIRGNGRPLHPSVVATREHYYQLLKRLK